MTCGEFKEQVAALALGMLDTGERAACERHLGEVATHEGCLAALRQANETAALLALSLPPVAPAAATWTAIEAATRAATALRPRRRLLDVAPWLVAAAAALLCAWALRERAVGRDAAAVARAEAQAAAGRAGDEARARAQCVAERDAYRRDAELRKEALALLQQPGARLVPLAQQAGTSASASVIWHPGKAFVLGRGLQAPSGRDYELWVIRGDRKIPAGLLRGDATGALVTAIDPALLAGGAPDAIAVTLEAAGGRPQPEGPIVLVGKI
jgi:hypothetical protein